MPRIQSLPSASSLKQFVSKVQAAHTPQKSSQNDFKQDAVKLTLGASGGILAFTALSLGKGQFHGLKQSAFILPALSGAVAGGLASKLTDHAAAQIAVGALTGAVAGLALSRLGLGDASSVMTGAVAGAGGSAFNQLLPD